MTTLDLEKPADNILQFLAYRAKAIQGYATLESSLCSMFTLLMNTDMNSGAIVFYHITSSSSRNKIIQELMESRYGDKYNAYFFGIPGTKENKGLWNLINACDSTRNQIVHWHTVSNINIDVQPHTNIVELAKPTAFLKGKTDNNVTADDMNEFAYKTDFVSRSLNIFCWSVLDSQNCSAGAINEWRDICSRPCVYPPSPDHPFARKS